MLTDIEQRQRLVLEDAGGLTKNSALIIEFDDVGNRDTVTQTFERVRKVLIERYGNSDNTFEPRIRSWAGWSVGSRWFMARVATGIRPLGVCPRIGVVARGSRFEASFLVI